MICAEGFLFEIERRGYMASGEFVPMVSLDHPEALENLHRDFQHAGSDIVQAFTWRFLKARYCEENSVLATPLAGTNFDSNIVNLGGFFV